jgi:hypothetical protein
MFRRLTRFETTYVLKDTNNGECPCLVRVSVIEWDDRPLQFHSAALSVTGQIKPREPASIYKVQQSLKNQSLWLSLSIDGDDEEWNFSFLMQSLLIIGHNSSYMSMLANNVCSCGKVINCQQTGQYADLTWVEKSQ